MGRVINLPEINNTFLEYVDGKTKSKFIYINLNFFEKRFFAGNIVRILGFDSKFEYFFNRKNLNFFNYQRN